MLDEIEALNEITSFKLLLLRKQDVKYNKRLKKLEACGLEIIRNPYKASYALKDYLLAVRLLFIYVFKYSNKKNFGFSMKSFLWFAKINLSIFSIEENIHSQFATQATILSFLLKRYYSNKIKYSFTVHAYDIFYNNSWLKTLVKHSHRCFSISEFNIKYLREKYNLSSDKIQITRLGVFTPKTHSESYHQMGKTLRIGFLSWLERKKGIFYLLDSINKARKNNLDIKLFIAGDGQLKREIEKYIISNNLNGNVELIGPVFGKEKEDFFKKLDLFILPSIKIPGDMDGIPVVLMEAISYGVPIISTNLSGIPEICKNQVNGYLLPEKNSEEIYKKIEYLHYNRSVLNSFKKNTRDIAEEYDIRKNSQNKALKLQWI